jgi:predicted helicase
MTSIQNYIENINRLYQTGNAREHSYRGDLQKLLNEIINDKEIIVTNEPARIRDVGAPDYSITKKKIPIGYIEAKDIGKRLNSKEYKEQFERYKNALPNLIITDYLEFWFYRNGKLTQEIQIAKIENNKIVANEENFNTFENSIKDFTSFISQTITNPQKLAKLMAGKARLLKDVIEKAILSNEENEANNSLKNEMKIFRLNLIHDITHESFADIYAQTITYGMFVARLHDDTLENFSRQEAQYLIPKSNPFLRGLFDYISGVNCDDRLIWIIDSLAEIFLATDVKKLLEGFNQKTGMQDPIIHFYETFLGEYNPKLRKSRGVWYTPEAVVNFIVRACDDILREEFNLEDGLIDETKIKIKVDDFDAGVTRSGKQRQKEKEVHKVQILDPATGTGTFLAEIIKFIKKKFWGGSWSDYVEKELIPRLNGFELLMASYAMAHLKLDLFLMETGYKPINPKRFNIFLTNSLEEHHKDTGTLFASYLANESKEADRVKKETPVMVVMGNPPYAVSSSNKGEWIQDLLKEYKKDLNEKKINLDDDYIKFIRYGQHFIDKNGEGILAYISNNSFIDGITHRQMRKSLLDSFDSIYILDLHGNSKKKETSPDGSKDENVFDIMQGVSINIFIKKKPKSKKLAKVFHYDLYGKREDKYKFLNDNSLNSVKWNELEYREPEYFFVKKYFENLNKYEKYIDLKTMYLKNSMGIATGKDNELVKFAESSFDCQYSEKVRRFFYRPFDVRYTIFDKKILQRARFNHMKNFLYADNLAFNIVRQSKLQGIEILISNDVSNRDLITNHTYNFPLYIYPNENSLDNERIPNLNFEIVKEIETKLNLKFVNEKEENQETFAPIDLLDYIYAVLHSPNYREKYKEFLKIDFPRVPYPTIETFWKLVEIGGKLRSLHLLEDNSLNEKVIDIEGEGSMSILNKLNKKDTIIENENVTLKINSEISIINIPLTAWNFYIGGYQPAQKWLKDRVGRELSRGDLKHYNKIINALIKTDKLMQEIDKIVVI